MALKFNFRFNLHNPTSEAPTPIYIIYHFHNRRLACSVGEKIIPKYWNADKNIQRPKLITELPAELPKEVAKQIAIENKRISNKLSNIETAFRKELQNYNSTITIPEIKDLQIFLDKFLGRKNKPAVIAKPLKTMLGYYEEFINDMRTGKRKNRKGAYKGKNMADSYIKSHGTTISNLKNYQKIYNHGKEIKFDDITLDWYHSFVQMLQDEGKAFNTIGCQIKNLKSFLRTTYSKDIHRNTIYLNEDFIAMREETDSIYLTEVELQKIYKLNLRSNLRLDSIRDLFVLACYTGLRYSDFSDLKPTDVVKVKSDYILTVKTQKTGKTVSIPLKKCVVEILKKYKWNFPKAISNQKMNVYLKEIGKLAKINTKVELSKTYNNQSKSIIKPKCEFIGCHTARRTFATNMYLSGLFEEADIMSMTGHKDTRVFRAYIKADSLQKAKKMLIQKSNYFK